jgi:sugar lactone lactonase YvrE
VTVSRARCLHAGGNLLGEGPVWHEGRLYWVDILGRAVHALQVDGDGGGAAVAHQRWPMPEPIGFFVPTTAGDFIVGLKRGLARLDLASLRLTDLGTPEPGQAGNRFNDGKCDDAGRLWAGTMHEGARDATGWLYCYTPGEGFRAADGPYPVTNGPAIAPDGVTLYHTDSNDRTIYAFDLTEAGGLARKRIFVRLPREDGYPDGMTVDAAGDVWVARFGGWGIDRYRADGSRAERIALPVANATSCAFGGPRHDRLFVTTARAGLDAAALARQPLAGGLFEIDTPGARGQPARLFRG